MSVKLRKRENKDGSTTLVLDIYNRGRRSYEFLKHLQLSSGSAPDVRQRNKENLELAKNIAAKRAHELAANDYDVATDRSKKTLVLEWAKNYVDAYKKKDRRVVEGVFKGFKKYLTDQKKLQLIMKDFTEAIALGFKDDLIRSHKGEGAKTYFSRFKKMVKQAVRENLLPKNPCEFIDPPRGEAKVKDVLTFVELATLAATNTDASEVKQAFMFSALTGLRFVDVNHLTWEQVDVKNKVLKMIQTKTTKAVEVPLHDAALEILKGRVKRKGVIFELPTANGCNKSLQLWVNRAGIAKKISWHSARHSFGTNLIHHGTDIYTTSQLLGHASLTHTKRYVRASKELNEKAIQRLPQIKL